MESQHSGGRSRVPDQLGLCNDSLKLTWAMVWKLVSKSQNWKQSNYFLCSTSQTCWWLPSWPWLTGSFYAKKLMIGFVSSAHETNLIKISLNLWGSNWRDGSMLKGTGCSSREPRFCSQTTMVANELYGTPVLQDPTPSSGLCIYTVPRGIYR